ncbi:hypothetical protein [uncultured Sphingomonas sp.]|mgnify:CR=1 FL=1|uniref:hypothetical protein n=1 Tax=uncultured Sphingomonas sp. TaxID=158754 RepID=UPI0026197B4C|nr:hypothetical protein [uncultured Sphingomonas sp.]
MDEWNGWTMSRAETAKWLAEAHKRRHRNGRADNTALKAKIVSARDSGDGARAEILSRQEWRKSISFVRRKRQREEAERDRDARRVGAAIRRNQRDADRAGRGSGNGPLFEFSPGKSGGRSRDGRDLYFEWISRGYGSGKGRSYKKSGSPRINARTATWQKGEFQSKIDYIEREEALEPVAGNLLSNMGEDRAERLGCAERIEELEGLGRKDAGVYVHSILALPADLSPEGRAVVLKELCGHYERLHLPYAAALHKPDAANSQKNFHAHIVLSLRPMRRRGDHWEFAASKLTWLSTPAGLRLQRRMIARAFNRALEAEKIVARWTHRSRADDGLSPGGFTKRGGVSRRHRATEMLETASENELVSDSEAVVQEIERLETIVEKLEASARILDQAERAAEELTGNRAMPNTANDAVVAGNGTGAAVGARQSDIDRASGDLPGPVTGIANPQFVPTAAHKAMVPRADAPGREGGLVERVTKPLKPVDAPSTVRTGATDRPVSPGPALMDDDEMRRRKLAAAARESRKRAEYRALSLREREVHDAYIDEAVRYLSMQSVALRASQGELDLFTQSDDLARIFQKIADSQPGWLALMDMALAINDAPPTRSMSKLRLDRPAGSGLAEHHRFVRDRDDRGR